MESHDVEKVLIQTFADFRLSRPEKIALREIFAELKGEPDLLRYARNRSFDLALQHMRGSTQHHLEVVKWIEQVVKTIDHVLGQVTPVKTQAHFSPGKDCLVKIISLIRNARRRIDVCVFTISDDRISDALIEAGKSGREIRIITDDEKTFDRGSDVRRLKEQGIAVRTDASPSHMHHKFAVIDSKMLINGSFNWTRSASTQNQENIVVTDDSNLISSFQEVFEKLWLTCTNL